MSMPYMPLYVDDYEAATAHLTLMEDGVYTRLLRLCWRSPGCKLPDDEAWIMRKLRAANDAERDAVRSVLAEFFITQRGKIFSKRLSKVHEQSSDVHRKRSEAGKVGAARKYMKTNETSTSKAIAEPEVCYSNGIAELKQPKPKPKPYISSAPAARFEEFWQAYPHRNGSKKGRKVAEAKYEKAVASGVEEQALIDAAIRYGKDRQVLDGYAKNPETWLNQGAWSDEVEVAKPKAVTPSNPNYGDMRHIKDYPETFTGFEWVRFHG